jgi:anti-sigma regulatory factor (Ser/Thr protein kinase)
MRELALHILDIVENALQADAHRVDLTIVENLNTDRLTISVQDDGRGMDAETVEKVRDPFYTTRSTRHVGLGIPLLAAATERCAGRLAIQSRPGQGTTVTATFQHSHIDRAPLGDMPSTLIAILLHERPCDLKYTHRVVDSSDEHTFELDSRQIKQELGDVPLSYPPIRRWLSEFVAQGEQRLKEN